MAAKKQTSVVVEIGNEWLKIVQGDPSKTGVSISRMHLEKLSSIADAASALSKAIKAKKFAGIPVVASLPRQVVNIRMLELPSEDPDEVADMVELQVGKQTPYSRDEITSGYRSFPSDRPGYTRVMLAIVQQSALRQRFSILEEAGVEPARMTVSLEGMLSWARSSIGTGGCVALLDVDSTCTDIVVMSGDGIAFSRTVLVGADQLLADDRKSKAKFTQEIARTLEAFQSDSPGSKVERVILTGAGPNVSGLVEHLSEDVGIPVEVVDCAKSVTGMPSSPGLDSDEYNVVSVTPLIGMALAPDSLELDLVPDSVGMRKSLVSRAKMLTAFAMLVMTGLVTFSLFGITKLYTNRTRLASLEAELAAKAPQVTEVKKMNAITRIVNRRLNPRFTMLNVLAKLNPLIPVDTFLDSIDIDLDLKMLNLSGTARSRRDARLLIKNMEQSPIFENVNDAVALVMNKGRAKFKIVCALEAEK